MNNTKHTQVPWIADSWLGEDPWEDPDTPFVQIGDVKWCPDKLDVPASIQQYADARLIAAAPDLLDACRKALYALKGREHDQFLRDAIAKATGEA
jgi:hypothetical protein